MSARRVALAVRPSPAIGRPLPNRGLVLALVGGAVAIGACGGGDDRGMPPGAASDSGVVMLDGGSELPGLLAEGAAVEMHEVAAAGEVPGATPRPWIPMDVTGDAQGRLWVIQRAMRIGNVDPERAGRFDDVTECTSREGQDADPSNDDCTSLFGSTLTIENPSADDLATIENGRASLVVDFNSWHFMRRPSGIAFGDPELVVEPGDPGTLDRSGMPVISEPQRFVDTFATCTEHLTGNFTDGAPFLGPSLWTADPAVYNGSNGSESWSNGSHLDMVHATQYCMGIAWEQDNVYWLFNGALGAFDRYDFAAPHLPGHFYHEDATITRYLWQEETLTRVENVPSNLVVLGSSLYAADTGGGRLVRFSTDATTEGTQTFRSYEGIEAQMVIDLPLDVLADRSALAAVWGGDPEPSGLATLDDETLVIADHASGQLALVTTAGEVLGAVDTGLGAGLGGLTVIDGTIYLAHMGRRMIYRVSY